MQATRFLTQDFQADNALHIHIFSFRHLKAAENEEAALALLSNSEIESYYRIRALQRRVEYLHGRATLRRLLACYSGASAGQILIKSENGAKPRASVAGDFHLPAFNLSHSRDVLAIAICSAGEVGIDVEQLDSNVIADMTSIAQDYFSSEEQRLLAAVPAAQLAEEFFRIWTLKEAVLKAAGVGLFHPLSSLCVAQKAARHALSLELDVGSTIMHAEHRTLPGDVHLAVARADSMSDISVFMHTRVN